METKKFRKVVEWDSEWNDRRGFSFIVGLISLTVFVTWSILWNNEQNPFLVLIPLGISTISFISMIIPKRKVYWEEIKDE